MAAGIDPHPAVKAISPQAPMIDVWMGDDFFHNGAFRQTYGYDYVFGMESNKESAEVSYGKDKDGKPEDGFDYFLERGSFAEDVKKSGVKQPFPSWKLFLDHPSYDMVWSSRGVEHHLTSVTVPTLSVGGYYDQEDMWGPQEEYKMLEPHDSKRENFLVLGPWRHGYWGSSSRHLGNLNYGESIGKEYRSQIEAKFFAHYLKDEPGFDLEDTASFQTGSNTWKRYSQFPPKEAQPTSLHLVGRCPPELERRQGTRKDQLRKRSGQSRSLQAPAHPANLWRGFAMVQLAHGRSALRLRSQRRGCLEAARAQKGPHRDRRSPCRHLRLDHRHRQRHGRQAHRPVPRRRSRPEDARLSAHDQRRDLSRPLSAKLREADADARRLRPRISLQPPRRGSRLQGRPHRDGRDPEHMVSALRPQSRRPLCPTS